MAAPMANLAPPQDLVQTLPERGPVVVLIGARGMVLENSAGAASSTLLLVVWGAAPDANHCLGGAAVRHETLAAASVATHEAGGHTNAHEVQVVGWEAPSWAL